MSKYEELDAMIMNALDFNVPTPFMAIHFSDGIHSGIYAECEKLATKQHEGFRVLDRRLQVLRKKGLIVSHGASKGWVKINHER
ncbi:hypothetical protein VIP0020 [Salmonella phage Vi II-E1]|uniref:Conserved hypothetical phage protein n=1 Tax=Salmonella phage Vi II-E1 TaxID=424716 RepID=B1GS76_9CAUD|nr:hypothetical protein VIP0020 [Salmonella phage Vi II-E1]CAM33125.1 conserved hypothetical phage protein [Salmonella phage Vi II-E1]